MRFSVRQWLPGEFAIVPEGRAPLPALFERPGDAERIADLLGQQYPDPAAQEQQAALAAGTVLVVDDDPSIVRFLEMALHEEGYTVLAAVGGAALRVAYDRHPDVILLDLMMPGMDGVEVSHRLRADPATADIPLIAMSAQERLRASASLMPVNDRLPKPFEVPDLYAKVAHWVHG